MLGATPRAPEGPTTSRPKPTALGIVLSARSLRGGALLCCVGLLGCGSQRAIALTVEVEGGGERLCVAASHSRLPTPIRLGYSLGEVAPPFTLTFLAGEEVSSEVQLAGWTLEGMRPRGRGASSVRFPERGATNATVRVRTCAVHPLRARGTRQGGTFAVLRSPPHLLAGDLDADGKDELFAIGEDGSLHVLDAEDPSRGSMRRTDLATLDGHVSDVADLDGDCAYDLAAASSTGALVVDGASGASPAPVGAAAREVRMGPFGGGGAPGLLVGGETGLWSTPWPVGSASMHSSDPVTHLEVRMEGARLRIVATGPGGMRWMSTSFGVLDDETDALATELAEATGPLALGDLDGDGALDVIVAQGNTLRLGLREDADVRFEAGPELTVPIVRVLATDLDGDCLDDVIVRGDDGSWAAFRGLDGGSFATPSIAALDLVCGDLDGDGEQEVAVLGAGGRITLWSP